MIDFCECKECYKSIYIKLFWRRRILKYCNNCSNCLNNDELKDYTIEAQKILSMCI